MVGGAPAATGWSAFCLLSTLHSSCGSGCREAGCLDTLCRAVPVLASSVFCARDIRCHFRVLGQAEKHLGTCCVVPDCFFAGASFQRALQWSDKLAFFQDAVTKSPGFGSVHYSLGGLLFQNGDIQQAADAFATADRLNKRDSMRYPIKAAIMRTKLAQNDFSGARSYFFHLFMTNRMPLFFSGTSLQD